MGRPPALLMACWQSGQLRPSVKRLIFIYVGSNPTRATWDSLRGLLPLHGNSVPMSYSVLKPTPSVGDTPICVSPTLGVS